MLPLNGIRFHEVVSTHARAGSIDALINMGIANENITIVVTQGLDNTLILDKQGNAYSSWPYREAFSTVDGLLDLTEAQQVPMDDIPKRKEVDTRFMLESRERFQEAHKGVTYSADMMFMPYIRQSEAPQGYASIIPDAVCAISNCHHMAKNKCSQCKAAWYCSKDCQIDDWKTRHKNMCKK